MQLTKQQIKTTLNYLTTNKIPHHIYNNTIISFPQTSPQFDNLYCTNTTCIHNNSNNKTPIILIHNY